MQYTASKNRYILQNIALKFVFMLKIKEIREQKNITQDEMVSLTGIPKRSYVNYENGQTDIPLSKLQNIAMSLNVSISELVGETKSIKNAPQEKGNILGNNLRNEPKVKNMFPNEEPPYNIVPLPSNRKTKDAVYPIQEIPLYDLEATAGLKELFSGGKSATQVLDTIKIPHLPKCDGAISITGDSMYPLLKSGDMVLYKEVPLDSIFYGEMYLLAYQIDDWEEYITVKYVQKSELGDEYLKLVSQNQHHQPRNVKKAQITAIAIIKASIRINTMM